MSFVKESFHGKQMLLLKALSKTTKVLSVGRKGVVSKSYVFHKNWPGTVLVKQTNDKI